MKGEKIFKEIYEMENNHQLTLMFSIDGGQSPYPEIAFHDLLKLRLKVHKKGNDFVITVFFDDDMFVSDGIEGVGTSIMASLEQLLNNLNNEKKNIDSKIKEVQELIQSLNPKQ